MDDKEKDPKLQVVDGVEHVEISGGEDWNPDSFPTSAKPIFRAGFLLVGLVAALCFAAYSCSDEVAEEPSSAPTFDSDSTEHPLIDN